MRHQTFSFAICSTRRNSKHVYPIQLKYLSDNKRGSLCIIEKKTAEYIQALYASSMNQIPVDVAIKALQTQVEELKLLLKAKQQTMEMKDDLPSNDDRVERLQIANAKAEYRIEFLLRALQERDAQLKQLKSDGVRTDSSTN